MALLECEVLLRFAMGGPRSARLRVARTSDLQISAHAMPSAPRTVSGCRSYWLLESSSSGPVLRRARLPSLPAAVCSETRTARGTPWLLALRGLPDQRDEALLRVLAIALPGRGALGRDDDDAVIGQPLAGKALQLFPHILGKVRRMANVEAQLHRGRDLVDVLSAGSGCADKAFLQFGPR